jgi:DNA-binding IclR family transcriptional regulator
MAERTVGAGGKRLLARLPPEEIERLLPHPSRVSFELGRVIQMHISKPVELAELVAVVSSLVGRSDKAE